jgi:hypothetical protein
MNSRNNIVMRLNKKWEVICDRKACINVGANISTLNARMYLLIEHFSHQFDRLHTHTLTLLYFRKVGSDFSSPARLYRVKGGKEERKRKLYINTHTQLMMTKSRTLYHSLVASSRKKIAVTTIRERDNKNKSIKAVKN